MSASVTASPADRRAGRPALLFLTLSGLLWGTGGLTGTEFGRVTGLSPLAVAACRLLAGGGLIVVFRTATAAAGGRWPAGRAAWTRIAVTGLLAAAFQGCYFMAVSLSSVSLATLVTIGGSGCSWACRPAGQGRPRCSPARGSRRSPRRASRP